jgi:Tol biopolymer transport system component
MRRWWLLVLVAGVCTGCSLAPTARPGVRQQATAPLILFWIAPPGEGELVCALMDRRGQSRRVVIESTGVSGSGWSPTGRSFVYLTNDGQVHVYDVGAARSSVVRLEGRYVDSVAYFPDGERLFLSWARRDSTGAFLGFGGYAVVHMGSRHIQWIGPANGLFDAHLSRSGRYVAGEVEQGVQLQSLSAGGELQSQGLLAKRQGQYVRGITWSPNDRYIAIHWASDARPTSNDAGKTMQERVDEASRRRSHQLWIYSTDGKGEWKVWTGTGGTLSMDWHPNSRRLALVTFDAERTLSQLRFADASERGWRTSAPRAFNGHVYPGGWSSDGSSFAYSLSAHSESRIYIAGPDADHASAISPAGARDLRPAWQP